MDVFRLALFLLIIRGSATQRLLEPQNAVALKGSQVSFNCSTTQSQTSMTWVLNRVMVFNIQSSSVVIPDARFSYRNLTTPGNYKWEFIIKSVEKSDAGNVACQVFNEVAQVSTLSVQERGTLEIVGGNRTVTEGVQTTFQCQALGWSPEPTMSWSVNDVFENNCNSSSVAGNASCVLTVTASKNSSIQCLAKVSSMSSPDKSTAFLTVVPASKTSIRDQTILIAVTVAFSAAALLFLLIVLIIICCRRKRRKSTYQEEIRRAQLQSQHRAPAAAAAVHGRSNRGYVTDRRSHGDYNGGVWHTNYNNRHQNYPANDFFEDGDKHRHMTML